MSVRIICINKEGGYHSDPHEAISRFGWLNESTRESGTSSLQEMIKFIEGGGEAYVKDKFGDVAYLEVRTSTFGHKYVRTIPDRTRADNLLKLDECTVR